VAEVKRIAIYGPESTGKTTLAWRLAEHFGEPWSPEFVREFWEVREGKIAASDLGTIALGQMANEDRAAAAARRVVFCDTELLTCVLWDDLLFPGACPAWVRTEAETRARDFAVYLFCETDVPFVPDPQRCFPDEAGRTRSRKRWRETLETRGLPCVEIRGDWRAREASAIAAVTAVMGSADI
jgi:HTH-type transcriptional regulator, transcriptional repressor of NAD biosynthesis genes